MTKLIVFKERTKEQVPGDPVWIARNELRRALTAALNYDQATICEMLKSLCSRLGYGCAELPNLLRVDKSLNVVGETRVFHVLPNPQYKIVVSVFLNRGRADVSFISEKQV